MKLIPINKLDETMDVNLSSTIKVEIRNNVRSYLQEDLIIWRTWNLVDEVLRETTN